MYGKAFESMYTGSMFGSPTIDFSLMGYVIACQRPRKADGECFVELNPALIAAMFSTTEQEVMESIGRLCSPDPRSRTPREEGRRLVPQTEDGKPAVGPTTYWVVNGKKYRELISEDERREYLRVAKQRERARKRNQDVDVNTSRDKSTKSTQAEAEVEEEKKEPPTPLSGDGTPAYGIHELAADFRRLTGNTSLARSGDYTSKQTQGLLALLSWARTEHPDRVGKALSERLRWGAADSWLKSQPPHVWAERIGALKPPAGEDPSGLTFDERLARQRKVMA